MDDVNILTDGFTSANARGFLAPMLRHRPVLEERGIRIKLFQEFSEDVGNCGTVLVESKFFRQDWATDPERIFTKLERLRERTGQLVWCDTTDSSGTLQAEVLPYVDRYCKNQLLIDRDRYLKPMYGNRLFTNFYHEKYGIEDSNATTFKPVDSKRQLAKLNVLWHSGLANHSLFSPLFARLAAIAPHRVSLRTPARWRNPDKPRPNDLTSRFGINYDRSTVRFQREQVRKILGSRLSTKKVRTRLLYWRELEQSKLMLSPFGWGEINLRDFEACITGCLLLKPSMEHMETWPPLLEAGETMLEFAWDLTNLEQKLERALDNYDNHIEKAIRAQERYKRYLVGERAGDLFADHFESVISV